MFDLGAPCFGVRSTMRGVVTVSRSVLIRSAQGRGVAGVALVRGSFVTGLDSSILGLYVLLVETLLLCVANLVCVDILGPWLGVGRN